MLAGSRGQRWWLAAVCAALTLGILAPVLAPGYVLVYDMSFVPRQAMLPESLGLGTGMPRAVPADALLALATTVIPGDILQKLVLCGLVFGGAWGIARLVPDRSPLTGSVAAVAYTWNPFVAERLLIGQWGLLVGYASLPWVVAAALALRERPDVPRWVAARRWAALVVASLPAVLTPTGGLLATGAALATAGRRRAPGVLGVGVVLNAPWWLPAVLQGGTGVSDPDGVAAFAVRSENWAGPVVSVLGLGGIWNAQTTPASRWNPALPVFTMLIVGLAVFGLVRLRREWGGAARGLAALAGLGLVLALAGSLPGLSTGLEWAVRHLPGAGLLRDGQKWAAWWALPLALGFALGTERLRGLTRDRLARRALAAGALLLPVAILPDLAWGVTGRLEPVAYPRDWQVVSGILARDERPGDVLTVPLSAYRSFSWNAGRTQYDPALRHLPRPTVIADQLKVGPVLVSGEDPRVVRVTAAAARGEPLGPLGVGWVLVEHGTPGPDVPLAGLSRIHHGEWLSLYRVPGRIGPAAGWPATTPLVVTVDLVVVAFGLVACAALLLPFGRLSASRGSVTSRREGE